MSGIKITKALYGAGSQTVDVTSSVTSHAKDGQVNLVVTADSLGVADPAPGQPKQLTVTYTINNGKSNTETVLENGVLAISAPAVRDANGLSIVKAEYGYDGNFTDVTNAVQTLVDNGSINLKVSPSNVGVPDPNPAKKKKLKVEYTLNGATNTDEFADGATFKLSAPVSTQRDSTPPSSYILQLIGVVFQSIMMFLGTCLYIISVFATADFFAPIIKDESGKDIIGKNRYLYLAIGAIPGIAYWGLPPYVFVRRLISNDYTLT